MMGPGARQMAMYLRQADRLVIPVEYYLSQGESGKRFCTKCKKWKLRSSFLEYEYTKTHYSGICKACTKGRTALKGENKITWGPYIAAANRLGITPQEYAGKKAQRLSWCVDHKGWFDDKGKVMERCAPCNRARVSAYRLGKKNESLRE